MACRFDEKILHLYIDGELGDETETRVSEHLRFCDECSAKVKAIENLKNGLSEVCLAVKATQHLRSRVVEKLDLEQSSSEIKFSLLDNIKIIFNNIKPAKAIIPGLVFAIVLLFVFIPNKDGLSNIAGILAKQHLQRHSLGIEDGLQTSISSEVSGFLDNYLGQRLNIPGNLGKDVCLKGCCLFKIKDMQVAHVCYASRLIDCSLFIIDSSILDDGRADYLVASGVKFRYGSSKNVNYICWQKALKVYILVSCCPHDELINLAMTVI